MEKLQSTYEVIATAVEKDTNSLRQLLLRNGVAALNSSKDELQRIITGALAESDTFRKEFKDWVLARSGTSVELNATGNEPGSLGGLLFGTPNVSYNPNLNTTTTSTTTTATTEDSKGFWSDISFNSILDFAKNGLNNYTEIVKSKTDKAIVDAAVEKERLNQNTVGTTVTGGGVPTWAIVLVVVALAGGIGYYVYTKKK